MWGVSAQWGEALAGSHRLTVRGSATLGGRLLAEIEPESWSWRRSLRGSQITDELSLSVVDPDGSLYSPDPAAPLRANGQRVELQAVLTVGRWSESVPMGVWRIEESSAEGGPWRLYRNGHWARPAQRVDVTGADLLALIAEYDWLGLSTPPWSATSESELRRIVDGTMPIMLGTAPRSVAAVPWEGSRMDALLSVVADMDAVAAVDRTGVLTTVPRAGTGAAVTITPADAQQPLAWGLGIIDWSAPSSRDGVYNGVAMTGTAEDGTTIYGRALEAGGPAAWSAAGYGRSVYKAHSPLLTTQAQVDAAAATRLDSLRRDRAQTLTITTIPDPAVDVLDTARVLLPGSDRTVEGLITDVALSSDGPMVLTVSVPWGVRIGV